MWFSACMHTGTCTCSEMYVRLHVRYARALRKIVAIRYVQRTYNTVLILVTLILPCTVLFLRECFQDLELSKNETRPPISFFNHHLWDLEYPCSRCTGTRLRSIRCTRFREQGRRTGPFLLLFTVVQPNAYGWVKEIHYVQSANVQNYVQSADVQNYVQSADVQSTGDVCYFYRQKKSSFFYYSLETAQCIVFVFIMGVPICMYSVLGRYLLVMLAREIQVFASSSRSVSGYSLFQSLIYFLMYIYRDKTCRY